MEINKDDLLRVGVITSTHGIGGDVKVYPTTDDAARFCDLDEVLLDTGKDIIPLTIEEVRFFKNMVILKFKGYDTISDIEKYKGHDLLVTRENAVPLEEGEFFICDVIGSIVYEEDGTEFGTLKDVLQTGANDVFVVVKFVFIDKQIVFKSRLFVVNCNSCLETAVSSFDITVTMVDTDNNRIVVCKNHNMYLLPFGKYFLKLKRQPVNFSQAALCVNYAVFCFLFSALRFRFTSSLQASQQYFASARVVLKVFPQVGQITSRRLSSAFSRM